MLSVIRPTVFMLSVIILNVLASLKMHQHINRLKQEVAKRTKKFCPFFGRSKAAPTS
jgi:hypothetical protein